MSGAYNDFFKPLLDYVIALLLLIILCPILCVVALCIKLETPGPILFFQDRIGRGGQAFKIIKFRTMYHHGGSGILLTAGAKDGRITRVGKLIRRIHLDEVIQLLNVLKGEMSLVGPRPEVPYYVSNTKQWNSVLQHKPGITGLAAVKCAVYEYSILAECEAGNQDHIYKQIILPKKLRYECFYAAHQSFCLDIMIIMQTLGYLQKRQYRVR
jgi:lipopolysaccharide/colanic/teichoic acid biosynthesis glycosyltransferase